MAVDSKRTLCDECMNIEYDHPADVPTHCNHVREDKTRADRWAEIKVVLFLGFLGGVGVTAYLFMVGVLP
jgi:ribosomal protein L37E